MESAVTEKHDPEWVEMWLSSLSRWFSETGNPLYAWEAIAHCLSADPPRSIPDWCLPYLVKAADNITDLAHGRDFRSKAPLQPLQALSRVAEALSLVRKGQKNAFAKVRDDGFVIRAALNESYGRPATDDVARKRNVSPDHARKIIGHGVRLLGLRRVKPAPEVLPPR